MITFKSELNTTLSELKSDLEVKMREILLLEDI